MPQTLIIVNADDLGGTVAINDAIFGLMEHGLVTSATILANAPGFDDAAGRLKSLPQCSFGVHLNLTAFAPLTADKAFAPILDERGCMTRKTERVTPTPALLRAAYRELCAQVERCRAAGIDITHFDSHNHIHTLPWLFPALKALQRKFGVVRLRSPITLLPDGEMSSGRRLKKGLYRLLARNVVAARMTDEMVSLLDFQKRLQNGLPVRARSIELMVHPGSTGLNAIREVELLRQGCLDAIPFPVRLGTFRDL